MNFEWQKFKIEDIAEVKSGKRLLYGHELVNQETPFPYIRLVDISNGKIQKENMKFLRPDSRESIKKYIVNSYDLCFAIVGHTIGMVFFVEPAWDGVNLTENAARLTNFSKEVNSKYLYYYLISRQGQLEILSRKVGSAQGKLPLYNIRSLEFWAPSRVKQNYIVNLLDSFSLRIELLRETNTNFESIAQALFKSWFVDFDPVHAKAEDRQSEGINAETAALFPDSFEESESGLVLRGWEVGELENLLELSYGKALSATNRAFGKVPVYGSGGITGYHNSPLVNGPSIIIGRKGTVGSLYWEDRAFFPIDTVFYVKTKVPLTYCYYLLKVLGLDKMNTDGAVPGLNRNNVYRLPIIIAENKILSAFDKIVKRLRQKIYINTEKTETLSAIRDTLLPRLISGQLPLSEVETLIGQVKKDSPCK